MTPPEANNETPAAGDPAASTDAIDAQRAAAEATHYRTGPLPGADAAARPTAESFFASANSIRLHARGARGGLAMKIAIPVIVSMLVGFLAVSLIIRNRVLDLQLGDLRIDAANTVFSASLIGRGLLRHREKFRRQHPDYQRQAEWKTGEHWIYSEGFVNAQDWLNATGFHLDEFAPASILEQAGIATVLGDLTRWINDPDSDTEIVAVYILTPDDAIIASSLSSSFRFNPLALKAIPQPGHYREIGGARVYVDYVADFEPEPVVRGIAHIMSREDPSRQIGTAVVIMRTQRHIRQQNSFLFLLLGLALILTAFTSVVCWFSSRRVTATIRRMAGDMQAIAEGDFTRRSPIAEQDEMGQLALAFNSMAERLRVARANEQETSRLESDLAIARSIQNNLLPPQTPRVRGLDIHTSYRPAREIGGDYYDFLPVDSQHMGIVVADASGKSIPAALVMSTTRAILRFVAPGNNSAAETLTRVNAILSVDIPKGMFVTAYYIILDPVTDSMLCASAGHTPLLIARNDGSVELMNPGGIALGFDSGPIFQRSIREQRVKLESGDRVLIYTDGVVECVNTANEEYSDRRLREFLRRNRELPSHDFVGALLADLDRHRGAAEMRDDTTIVTFRVL